MTGYETLRLRQVADSDARTGELIARLSWPADRLAAHRRDELRRMVRLVRERSPCTATASRTSMPTTWTSEVSPSYR